MVYKPLATRYGTAISQAHRLRSLAREQTEKALNVIQGILDNPTTSNRDKLTAAFGLLDRGWGKPTQVIMEEGAHETVRRKLTYEIVHVNETQEELDQDDLVVDFHEIKTNGNGHDQSN